MIICKVIDLLVDWGLVVCCYGLGIYVVCKDVYYEISNLIGLVEVLCKQGKEVVSQVLVFEVMFVLLVIVSLLWIKIDEWIYFLWWVCYVDGKLLMLEDSYMLVKLFCNLLLSYLEGLKFDYIEKECGIIISGNYEMLMLVLVDKQLVCLMNVLEQMLLLCIIFFFYSDSGEFFNYLVMFCNVSEYQVDYYLCCVQV